MRPLLLIRCGQLCFPSSEIAWFFAHECLWIKEYLSFLHKGSHKVHLRLLLLVAQGQSCFFSNQITGFFYHLRNESFDILHLIYRQSPRGGNILDYCVWLGVAKCVSCPIILDKMVASGTTTFGLIWSGVPLLQLDCKMIWSSVPLEEINEYLIFFEWR